MGKSIDPNKVIDYVMNSNDPVSDDDLYQKFKLTVDEILPVLENSGRTIFYRRTSDRGDFRFSSEKVDDRWNLLRRLSTKFQYDDGGREAARVVGMKSDCVIRALSIVARHEPECPVGPTHYHRVYQELFKIAADVAVEELQYDLELPEGGGIPKSIYGPWLKERGWVRLDVKGTGAPPTVREFINEKSPDEDKSIMLLSTRYEREHHLVAVVDGVILDMDNCSEHLVIEAWGQGQTEL
jgi:hypothetical protein